MNLLLIFFALPIATIIISIALQKILKCPPLVAAIIFAIFLIVTFIINNLNFLVAAIVYAIISFITAVIVCFICRILNRCNSSCRRDRNERDNDCCSSINSDDFFTINSDFESNGNNGVFTINALNSDGINENNNCECNNCRRNNCRCNNCISNSNSNRVSARINVIPNSDTNGRTGCLCGNYRRR